VIAARKTPEDTTISSVTLMARLLCRWHFGKRRTSFWTRFLNGQLGHLGEESAYHVRNKS
jgi:hypothetical protein